MASTNKNSQKVILVNPPRGGESAVEDMIKKEIAASKGLQAFCGDQISDQPDFNRKSAQATLRGKSLDCLKPEEFLNDELIDFFTHHIQYRNFNRSEKRIIIFNSMFNKKLEKMNEKALKEYSKRFLHDRGGDDGMKDKKLFIFVENYKAAHWRLHLVVLGEERPLASEHMNIYEFDPLGKKRGCAEFAKKLGQFLDYVLEGQKKDSKISFEGKLCRSPRQPNGYDCGVYVCLNILSIYRYRNENFSPSAREGWWSKTIEEQFCETYKNHETFRIQYIEYVKNMFENFEELSDDDDSTFAVWSKTKDDEGQLTPEILGAKTKDDESQLTPEILGAFLDETMRLQTLAHRSPLEDMKRSEVIKLFAELGVSREFVDTVHPDLGIPDL